MNLRNAQTFDFTLLITLSLNSVDLVDEGDWIIQGLHIQNFFRMFLYQILSALPQNIYAELIPAENFVAA